MPIHVVVTGGGTIAPIDDVRHIANASSGRLSAMITEACLERGATVWHIHAPSALLPLVRHARFDLDTDDPAAEQARLARLHARWQRVRDRLHLLPLAEGTVREYQDTLRHVLSTHPIDVVFLAMAVSDFEPEAVPGKIETPPTPTAIPCRPTPKVIRSVRDWAPDVYLVGFKLLSHVPTSQLIRDAELACQINRADLTVANDLKTVKAGRHTIYLVRPGHPVLKYRGETMADDLVDRVFDWASCRGASRAGS